MRTLAFACALVLVAAGSGAAPEWKMNGTIIEACSCPMFCSCYFGSGHPAGHHNMESHAEEHFCRFNNAVRVNRGNYGAAKLDRAKFWVAGDLGGEFAKGAEWAVLTFDKKSSKEQRDGITAIVGKLYNIPFKSFKTAEGDIQWVAGDAESHATLDAGKTPVIKDLQYWGSSKNDGFVLMPNSVEAFRAGDAPFEFSGTNGFMITFDIDSKSAGSSSSN